jgi:lysine 2,3-aminomutase
MSGLGIPTYVVDSPHGGGKIPMMPNYMVSMSDDAVVLRNYEGMLIRYQAEDKPAAIQPTKTRGVSALLQGSKTVLVPEDNERMARRRTSLTVVGDHAPGAVNGNGCCGGGDHHDHHETPSGENGITPELVALTLNGKPY